MTLNSSQIRIGGWAGVSLVVLGQLLPWGFRSRPIGQAWDWLFSPVSSPNLEWWVWLLGPAVAAALAAKGLVEQNLVPRMTAAPAIIFFAFWALLIFSGVKRYARTSDTGPLITIVGLLILLTLAFSRRAPAASARGALPVRR